MTHDGKRWSNADQDRVDHLYAALKRELAARYATDRDAYSEGKARYVDDTVRKAGNP